MGSIDVLEGGIVRASCKNDAPVIAGADAANDLLRWKTVRDRLSRATPPRLRHEAIEVVVDRDEGEGGDGIVLDVRVLKDHLEKDQIRWWSASDLRAVLRNRGSYCGERFRPYFLPVLQTILDALSRNPPSAFPDASCPDAEGGQHAEDEDGERREGEEEEGELKRAEEDITDGGTQALP